MTGDNSAVTVVADPTGAAADLADRRRLRSVFATFATGVTVVTVGGEAPHGMTANSFTAVSLDPPLVLVCVDQDARMRRAMLHAESFAVSILAAGQAGIARHFADTTRPPGRGQFDPIGWTPGPNTGAPLINNALAWLECRRWSTYDGGDHDIFLGRLVSAARSEGGDSLLFFDGQFGATGPEGSA